MPILSPLSVTGPSANRVDIIVMGDGYTSSEIVTTYTSHVSGLLGYLFDGSTLTQPFGRYRSFFNVYSIDLVSSESGADDPPALIYRDTVLDASYRYDGRTDRLLYINEATARSIQNKTLNGTGINPEMRFVVVNDTKFGGGGDYYAVYAGGDASANEIALHEIGHSFAGLADEYTYGGGVTYTGSEPRDPNVTTDSSGAKWAEWIGYDQPGIGEIGVYEGGYSHQRGVYRPSENSKMRSLGQPFDAVAREQFILKFYELVDPLDSYTDNSTEKQDPISLSVDVIDPAVITVDWSVDGRTFPRMGETLRFDFDGFGLGTYTVRARAYDDTDWVRGDRSTLEQTVTWTVVNNTRLYGGNSHDTLHGNSLNNDIQGRGGHDMLFGGAGSDTLLGGMGEDRLDGGFGADQMAGLGGNDIYMVDNASDTVTERPGGGSDLVHSSVSYALPFEVENLTLFGSAAIAGTGNALANIITGNSGKDRLSGGAGSDQVFGLNGIDRLDGGPGADILTGGRHRDFLTGGSARDLFDYNAVNESGRTNSTRDQILDFGRRQDDIDLRTIDACTKKRGNDAFIFVGEEGFSGAAGELRIVDLGSHVLVQADVNGNGRSDFEILVRNIGTLSERDFLL